MTITATTNRIQYTGDGVSTAFTFPFRVFAATDVAVYLDNDLQAAGYSVTGGDPAGTVTFVIPPASGVTVTLLRAVPYTQSTDYVPNDPFPAETHEQALDRGVVLAAQTRDLVLTRALLAPEGEAAMAALPSRTDRASRLLGFGPGGDPDTYSPPAISGLSEVLPDGGDVAIAADWAIRKILEVDIAAFGADPDGLPATNDTAIALAVARANSIGGVLAAELVRGDYRFSANIPALTHARGIAMAGSRFLCSDAGQTGAFLSLGRLVTGGIQRPVLRGVAVVRETIADWTDDSQVGLLLRCIQNADGDIAEAHGFTIGVRLQGEYDGSTAADCVHNKLALGRLWNCRYLLDLYSDSPAQAGAINNNRFFGGDFTAQTGVNTSTDRYGISLRRRTWLSTTFTANATTDELTLASGSIPVNGRVTLSTTGTLPSGLVAGTYYVVSSVGSVIQLGVTPGGAAVDFTDAGIGTHSLICQGYNSHNTNLWIGPSFQHARPGTGVAYCVVSEVDAQQNQVTHARAEWASPAVLRGSLTMAGGGPNEIQCDYATSYLASELSDVVDSGATKAAWRTTNHRYSETAFDAVRPVIVIPDLRRTVFADYADGPVSYGFDDLHVAYTTAPAGGVGTATIATCVLRNDQRSSLSAGQGIVVNSASITIGAARGIGIIVDCAEAKWFFPVITQAAGARDARWAFRCFDASGVLLGSSDRVVTDHPSMSVAWNGTSLFWQMTAAQSDANQGGRVCFCLPETAKFAQVFLLYAGADIEEVQSFAIYTPEPYPVRAFHGVAGGTRELVGTATWNPPSIADGAQSVQTVTVTGAAVGDLVMVSLTESVGNILLVGYVQGSNTVAAVLQNETGGPLDLSSATLTATAIKARVA